MRADSQPQTDYLVLLKVAARCSLRDMSNAEDKLPY